MPSRSLSLAAAFGQVVRDARLAAGWSQEKLASKADLHRTYVGDLENARKSPTLDVVEKLGSALGRSTDELLTAAEHLRRVHRAPTAVPRRRAT